MRSLSLALVIALLVGPCAIAIPKPPKGNQRPAGLSLLDQGAPDNQATTSAKGEQRATTPPSPTDSQHSNAESDTTLGADDFDPNDIDRSQSGWAKLKTKYYDRVLRHKEKPNRETRKLQELKHVAYVLGSSKSTGKLYVAPLTNKYLPSNRRYVPRPASDYMTGNRINGETIVHGGVPFRIHRSKIHMLTNTEKTTYGLHMTKKQDDKFHQDMENNIRNPPTQPAAHPPAGHEGHGGGHGGGGTQH